MIQVIDREPVGTAAGKMVDEIRRQFREIPGLLEGKPGVKPDSQTCVDISTKASLQEMIAPGADCYPVNCRGWKVMQGCRPLRTLMVGYNS